MEYSRVRSRGNGFTSKLTQRAYDTWDDCSQTVETQVSSSQYYADGELTTMEDCVTPQFYRRSAKGDIIMTPMHSLYRRVDSIPGNGVQRQWTTPTVCGGVSHYPIKRDLYWIGPGAYSIKKYGVGLAVGSILNPIDLLSGTDINNLFVEVGTSLLNKRGRSDQSLWEDLAQFDKTLTLLPDMFHSARKLLPSRGRARFSKGISELWLQNRYGLQPVIADIHGVMSGLEKAIGTIRKTSRASGTLKAQSYDFIDYAGSSVGVKIVAENHDEYVVRAMSIDELFANRLYNVGLSGKDLIALPWELVKYSFVLDWFANIGDFLGALVDIGLKSLGSCIVTRRTKSLALLPNGEYTVNGWVPTASQTGSYFSLSVEKRRVIGLPKPGLVLKHDFRFDHLTRSLDALALLLQKIGR